MPYPFRGEDEFISLQRLPGQERTTHTRPAHQPDNFAYIVLMDDPIIHTADHPFCFCDPGCPCHEDQEAIQTVNRWVQEGLMTLQEATEYISGRTL